MILLQYEMESFIAPNTVQLCIFLKKGELEDGGFFSFWEIMGKVVEGGESCAREICRL